MKSAPEAYTDRLAAARKVAVDTGPFDLYLRGEPSHAALTLALFEAVEQGRIEAVTSVLTLMDLLVAPYARKDEATVQEFNFLLPTFPHLALVPVSRTIADKAASWQARYRLPAASCVQVATAVVEGADLFVTADPAVKKLQGEIEVLILEEYL